LIVALDWPNPKLAPNRSTGKHWGGLAAIKSKAHTDAYHLAKIAQNGNLFNPEKDYPLSIIFVMPDKRRRDLDNLLASMKHSLDGIAKAIGVDDKRFKPILIDWEYGAKPGAVLVGVGVELRSGVNL
jgi:crossover junction endodeoxyribonuclease RusA